VEPLDGALEADLLQSARAGDRRALGRLLEREQTRIYRYGLQMCRSPEDAADVTQETLFALARGVSTFRGDASLSTWLYTVARSFCLKKRRRRRHDPVVVESLDADEGRGARDVPDRRELPEEALGRQEVDRALDSAMGSLAPSVRDVVVLRDVEGLTAPEVAEVLGIGVTAVKSRLHRGRLALRAQLAPLFHDDGGGPLPTCPDVISVFSRHLEGETTSADCAEMERHLASCGRCAGACESLRRTLALCRRAAPARAVPVAVQHAIQGALSRFLAEQEA
jgi:RNA polymerase sigma-70 factor (ECF subfamily)